jgi:hypothetical protein
MRHVIVPLLAGSGVIGAVALYFRLSQPGQFFESRPSTNISTPSLSPPAISQPLSTPTSFSPTPSEKPTPTPSPTPTTTPTATPTPTPSPSPTPTPTATPNPTPTATPQAPPQPLDSADSAEKSQPKKAPRFKLGPIFVDVDDVKNARSDLQVYITITNPSNRAVYVFAGSPDPIAASWRQRPRGSQALTGRGSDDKNSTFWLQSVEGFTRSDEKYFTGENIYVELGPKESANASFLLANNWLTGPELGKTVNLSIELAIVTNLRSRGAHQTRALTLTKWPLD